MVSSTDQVQKYITKLQSRSIAEKDKAMGAILAHLDDLRSRRPTILLEAGKTEKAQRTVAKILTSAHEIFTRDGHAGLSLRKVADHAGIAVGNLTYHFPTKDALLQSMLREALADYVEAHLAQFEHKQDTPLDILLNVVEFYVRNARASHRFFYQLWGFAGSSDEARMTVSQLYQPIGRFVYYLIRAANPKLTDTQIRRATLQIFSIEEGYKLFIGMGPEDAPAIRTAEHDIRALTKAIVLGETFL